MAVTFLTNEDEKRFVKSINDIEPDEKGNVKVDIDVPDIDLTDYATEQFVRDGFQPKGNYLTEVPSGYATEEFVQNKISESELGGGKVDLMTDETLTLKDGVLSVNTTNDMEQDNTLPITSAGVFATVGNIEALLKTI